MKGFFDGYQTQNANYAHTNSINNKSHSSNSESDFSKNYALIGLIQDQCEQLRSLGAISHPSHYCSATSSPHYFSPHPTKLIGVVPHTPHILQRLKIKKKGAVRASDVVVIPQ